MEERGHLGKKYEGESQEPSADLWGKIEPKIERKRRPFGLLWWLGLGGTMLLFVGLWKAGTDTKVPISSKSKPAVEAKASPKSNPMVEEQAMSQNQKSDPKSKSTDQTGTIPLLDSKPKSTGNQPAQDVAATESGSNSEAKTNTFQKTKSGTKNHQSFLIQRPKEEVPNLAKSEAKNEKTAPDNKTELIYGKDEGLIATQESPKIEKMTVAQLSEGENPSKKGSHAAIEISVPAESMNTDPSSNQESNRKTTAPPVELNVENSRALAVDSTEFKASEALALNSQIKSESHLLVDSTHKKLNTDLSAHASDTAKNDSGRAAQMNNWKLGFSIGGFYTSKNMTINQNPEENRVQVVNINAFSTDRFAWSATIWLQKSIRSQLSWYASLGVLFIQDQTNLNVKNDTILSYSERTDPSGNKFLKPVYGEWNRSIQTRKLFLEVQAGLVYSNLFGPMGFKIGPGLNYLLWDDRKVIEKPAPSGTEPTSTSRIQPTINMAIPFSWSLGRRQNLVVEPSVSYFLSPAFHPYSGSDVKPFLAGLKIGFSW